MNFNGKSITLCVFPIYYLAIIHTVMFDFERTISVGNTTEVVSGAIYYDPQGKSIIEVKHPILQYMLFADNHWTVYYPEKGTAYAFTDNQPFQVPFVDILLASLKEDFGLLNAGFRLQRHEVHQDTIVTFWIKTETLQDFQIKLVQIKEKYVRFELLEKDTTRVKSTFVKYHQFEDKFFPIEVYSEIFPGWVGNNQKIMETLRINNLQINQPFPELIVKFEIPSNVEVKGFNK